MPQAVMITMADASQASVTLAGHDAHIDMISSHFQVPVTWTLKGEQSETWRLEESKM